MPGPPGSGKLSRRMRKLFLVMSLATSIFAAGAQAPAVSAHVPRKSGEFVFQMTNGPEKLLTSYRGKTIVMALMYTTCPHCQKTAGVLSKVQTEYAAKGVQVLGVTFDTGAASRLDQFN